MLYFSVTFPRIQKYNLNVEKQLHTLPDFASNDIDETKLVKSAFKHQRQAMNVLRATEK